MLKKLPKASLFVVGLISLVSPTAISSVWIWIIGSGEEFVWLTGANSVSREPP